MGFAQAKGDFRSGELFSLGREHDSGLSGFSLKRDSPRLSETTSLRTKGSRLRESSRSWVSGFSLRRDPPRLSEITSLKMPKLSLEREFVLGKGLSFCNSRLGESSSPGRDQQRTSPSHACKLKSTTQTSKQFIYTSCNLDTAMFQHPKHQTTQNTLKKRVWV